MANDSIRKNFTVSFPKSDSMRMEEYAKQSGQSGAELIRQATSQYINRKEAVQVFKSEISEALDDAMQRFIERQYEAEKLINAKMERNVLTLRQNVDSLFEELKQLSRMQTENYEQAQENLYHETHKSQQYLVDLIDKLKDIKPSNHAPATKRPGDPVERSSRS